MSSYLNKKYNTSVVLEKYVGRKPELIMIEKELVTLVERIKTDVFTVRNIKGNYTAKDLNNSDENRKIERLFKEFFGLKDFVLNWLWTPIPDAHTMVKTYQILDFNYEKAKDGRDFNNKLFIGVNISTGMVTLMDMEADEILAVILHEIGHSFNATLSQVLAMSSPVVLGRTPDGDLGVISGIPITILYDIIGLNQIYTHIKTYQENIKDALKPISKASNFLSELAAYAFSMLPSSIALLNPVGIVNAFLNPFRLIFLYNVEKHSDGFAVDYGYGKEMASALNKLDRSHDHPKMDVPVLNWIYAFDDVIHEMLLEPLTGYPNLHNRQRSALDRLKSAAKDKDLDPRTRKELERQIKEFDKYYNDYYMNFKDNDNKKYFATWAMRKFVDKFFKGKMDIRELVYAMAKDNPKNHDYAKEYDKFQKKTQEKINKTKK